MEVVSIERSAYEELLTSFNSFVTKMKEMAVEAITKVWATGLTTKTFAKC